MNNSRSKAQKNASATLNVGTWTQAEDDLLKDAVAKHGPRWVVVAAEVGTRNGDQCAKRWNENLNPELDHSPWSVVEDKLLVHLVELYGRNWTSIANKFFEKRPPLSLKNRMSYLERRQKREDRARGSQRRGQQSSYTSVSPPASQLPGMAVMPDAAPNIAGTVTPELDTSRHSGSPSSPSSNTEGEQAVPLRWNNSAGDLSHFFSTLATGLVTKQSSPTTAQRHMSHDTMQDEHMFYIPDQVDLHGLMDDSAAFGHAVGNGGPPFESHAVAMPYMLDNLGPDTANPRAGSSRRSDDAVEYSLTCPLGQVKSLVQHLVDAAMPVSSESGERNEEQVVLSLKMRKL